MSPNEELGPPPAPKAVNRPLPPMPPDLAKKFPEQAAAVKSGGAPGGGAPMMAGGQPMMMAQNGFPMVGGMGPNLVFNFYSPGGAMMCQQPQPAKEEKEEPKDPGPPVRVQGDPTWCQPRVVVGVGKQVKNSPCVIM